MQIALSPAMEQLPLEVSVRGAIGIALNVELARFTYGVMLPSIRCDLGLNYFCSGNLNAVHLAGYLIGSLAAPSVIARSCPCVYGGSCIKGVRVRRSGFGAICHRARYSGRNRRHSRHRVWCNYGQAAPLVALQPMVVKVKADAPASNC